MKQKMAHGMARALAGVTIGALLAARAGRRWPALFAFGAWLARRRRPVETGAPVAPFLVGTRRPAPAAPAWETFDRRTRLPITWCSSTWWAGDDSPVIHCERVGGHLAPHFSVTTGREW